MLWLRIVRILDVLGIIASLVGLNTDHNNKLVYGSILIIQIFALLFLNAKINDIQSKKRVVKILDTLLDEMKEEGMDNLKDLKRNQNDTK